MLFIPAIGLNDGHCVRLKQGDMNQSTIFSEDPGEMVRCWIDKGARHLHPTTWLKKVCRFAMLTKPSRTPSKRLCRTRWICPSCRWRCCRAFTQASRKMCLMFWACVARSTRVTCWVAPRRNRCGYRLSGIGPDWANADATFYYIIYSL